MWGRYNLFLTRLSAWAGQISLQRASRPRLDPSPWPPLAQVAHFGFWIVPRLLCAGSCPSTYYGAQPCLEVRVFIHSQLTSLAQ